MVTVQQACAFVAYAVRRRRFGKSKSHCEAILDGFWHVTMKVLNSYKLCIMVNTHTCDIIRQRSQKYNRANFKKNYYFFLCASRISLHLVLWMIQSNIIFINVLSESFYYISLKFKYKRFREYIINKKKDRKAR